MKRQAVVILTTLSLFVMLAATSVRAQSDVHFKVNIPFEFSVGRKVLPAGEYTVKHLAQTAMAIQSVGGRASEIFLTLDARAGSARNESSMVFNRYGDQYFLSTIWTTGNDTGRQLVESRAERELIRARRALASARGESERETVSIIAHR